jgi:hypothetical protein
MAQLTVQSPFRKFYLSYQDRFNPFASLHYSRRYPLTPSSPPLLRQVHKRTSRPQNPLHSVVHLLQKSFRKPGPNAAGKHQSFRGIVPYKQTAKVFPAALRWRVPANHKFLFLDKFELHPTLINSIDPGTAFRVSFPLSGEQQEDEIFSGHQACRRNLAALLFGPCRIGCSSFERKAE